MADETVTVKGSPVRSLQRFIESSLSPEERDAVYRNLPPEYATRFRTPILATETIPVHMLNRFTEEAAKAKGVSVTEFAQSVGREGASDAVKGIYRFFALVLTPTALLAKASQMWSSLYNSGQMLIEDQTDHSATIRIVEFPSELAGCSRITGWIERMAEMTGAKNIVVQHPKCFTNGAPACEWTVTWE